MTYRTTLNRIIIALLIVSLLSFSGCGSQNYSKDYSKDFSDIVPLNFNTTADDVEQFESSMFGNSDRKIISGKIGGKCRIGYAQYESSNGNIFCKHYYSFDESGTLESIEYRSSAGTKSANAECIHWEQYVDMIEKNFVKWDFVDESGCCELYGNVNGAPCKILYYPDLNIGFYRETDE